MAKIAGRGGMLSVSLGAGELRPYAEGLDERVSLAAVNGPASLVLSGEPEALDSIRAACEADGVRAKAVAVDYAAHSPQIEALREELEAAFAPISSAHGRDPNDLHRHRRADRGPRADPRVLVPQPARDGAVGAGRPRAARRRPARLRRGRPAPGARLRPRRRRSRGPSRTLRRRRWSPACGATSRTAGASPSRSPRRTPAASRSTGRRSCATRRRAACRCRPIPSSAAATGWRRTSGPRTPRRSGCATRTPFLGAAMEDVRGEGRRLQRPDLARRPPVARRPRGERRGAAARRPRSSSWRWPPPRRSAAGGVEELTISAPLVLGAEEGVALRVRSGRTTEGGATVRSTRAPARGGGWAEHASGALSGARAAEPEPPAEWPPAGAEPLRAEPLYDLLAEAGHRVRPAFQGLTAAWRAGEKSSSRPRCPRGRGIGARGFALHPALLDSALHGVA